MRANLRSFDETFKLSSYISIIYNTLWTLALALRWLIVAIDYFAVGVNFAYNPDAAAAVLAVTPLTNVVIPFRHCNWRVFKLSDIIFIRS